MGTLGDCCGVIVRYVEQGVLDCFPSAAATAAVTAEAEVGGEPNMNDNNAVGGEVATTTARTGRRSSQLRSWPKYFGPPALKPGILKPGTRVKVAQLWGLTHCVDPAWDRLAGMGSIGNVWTTHLRIGVYDAQRLSKRHLPCHESAEVSALLGCDVVMSHREKYNNSPPEQKWEKRPLNPMIKPIRLRMVSSSVVKHKTKIGHFLRVEL